MRIPTFIAAALLAAALTTPRAATAQTPTVTAEGDSSVVTPVDAPFSVYVGVSTAVNVTSGGGSFGYGLNASVGLQYRRVALELSSGTTSLNGAEERPVGPHFGAALRVEALSAETFALQLGLGVRRHAWRGGQNAPDDATGVNGSLRLLLPLTEYARVRMDIEYERLLGEQWSDRGGHILSVGFGLETRFAL